MRSLKHLAAVIVVSVGSIVLPSCREVHESSRRVHFEGDRDRIKLLMLTGWSIEDEFQLFAKHMGIRIVFDEEVKSEIRNRIIAEDYNDMSWPDALTSLAASHGFELLEDGPSQMRVRRRAQ